MTENPMQPPSHADSLAEIASQAAIFNENIEEKIAQLRQENGKATRLESTLKQVRSRALDLIRMERDTALRMIREAQSGSTRAADEERRDASSGRVITE